MNIGDVARETGLPVKTIRYYEEIGLVSPDRSGNGYRDFDTDEVNRLRFLAQARHLGFSLEECRKLVALYGDEGRASRDVRALASQHLAEVRNRIAQLQDLERTLQSVISECRGDDTPHCAILDRLSGAKA